MFLFNEHNICLFSPELVVLSVGRIMDHAVGGGHKNVGLNLRSCLISWVILGKLAQSLMCQSTTCDPALSLQCLCTSVSTIRNWMVVVCWRNGLWMDRVGVESSHLVGSVEYLHTSHLSWAMSLSPSLVVYHKADYLISLWSYCGCFVPHHVWQNYGVQSS